MTDPSALESPCHPLRGLYTERRHPSWVLRCLSALDPLLAKKLTFLPPRLTPWLPATELRIPSVETQLPLSDCAASASALRRLASAFLWMSLCPLSTLYSPEIPSPRFSLPLYCKISSIDFPPENFSFHKIDFESLCVFSK